MRDLHDALAQIREIRARMATSQTYRGYRVAPTIMSALLAVAAGCVQHMWIARGDIYAYVALWSTCAAVSVCLAAIAMARHGSPARTRHAVGRIAPPLIAAAVVTWVLMHNEPQLGYLLPGLWQVFFALGLLASGRLLPDGLHVVGGLYFVSGCFALSLGPAALSPSVMAVPFAAGQAAAAWLLYLHREADDDER